jgi:hypothetical protein
MVPENDKILDTLIRWERRIFAGYLLAALILGASALILLKVGLIRRIWEIEFPATNVTEIHSCSCVRTNVKVGKKNASPSSGATSKRMKLSTHAKMQTMCSCCKKATTTE